jgi:putative flippase GtrA
MSLPRQITVFALVGVVATLLHYCVLVALVEIAHCPPVTAALCGYVVGGILSYGLNRRHTFASDRPHQEATWRFAVVAFVGFCLTFLFMRLFVERLAAPYLPAQVVTTGIVFFWSFVANRFWTFRPAA